MKKYRDASGRLTIDFDNVESSKYKNLTKKIIQEFDLKPATSIVSGMDEIFQDFKYQDKEIGLAWDVWSGYSICSKNINAEDLIVEIANFVKSEIEK